MDIPNREEYLARMRIPLRFQSASLAKIEKPQKDLVLKYVKNLPEALTNGWGLLLWGNFGSGKSAAACAIMLATASIHRTALFVTANDIAEYVIKKTYFDEDETIVDRMQSVDLLVIDELILKTGDSFKDTVVEDVFRRRTNNVKSTIFTSNLSTKVIQEVYPALASVLQGSVFPIKFSGELREPEKSKLSAFMME